jgi:hypothetical protein
MPRIGQLLTSQFLARTADNELTDGQKAAKRELGDELINGIKPFLGYGLPD